MNIITLETGLFPDQNRVRSAVDALAAQEHTIARVNIAALAADDDDGWDMVVREIMKAAKVITI